MSFPITGGFAAIHSDLGYKPGYIAGTVLHEASGLRFSKVVSYGNGLDLSRYDPA